MPKPIATQYQCRHLHADGRRCGSRSLRLEPFCYFHHTTRRPKTFPHAAPPQTSPDPAHIPFDLPHPEDRTAIQLSIGEILRRIALNQIDPRRAGLLLYGLQIASANLPKPPRQGRNRRSEPIDEPVDEIVHHPTHGPLAPQAEYTPEGERYSFTAQLLRQMEEGEDPEPQQNTPDPLTSATIQTLQATTDGGTLRLRAVTVNQDAHSSVGSAAAREPVVRIPTKASAVLAPSRSPVTRPRQTHRPHVCPYCALTETELPTEFVSVTDTFPTVLASLSSVNCCV